ncbi:hypothetical protein, partial [Pseudomonas sp. BIS1]|uniref:hypothetical protein n=1 Tax=Pseudomonas sp. BIS1 TaxID=2807722 RepID=UPI001EEE264D
MSIKTNSRLTTSPATAKRKSDITPPSLHKLHDLHASLESLGVLLKTISGLFVVLGRLGRRFVHLDLELEKLLFQLGMIVMHHGAPPA